MTYMVTDLSPASTLVTTLARMMMEALYVNVNLWRWVIFQTFLTVMKHRIVSDI